MQRYDTSTTGYSSENPSLCIDFRYHDAVDLRSQRKSYIEHFDRINVALVEMPRRCTARSLQQRDSINSYGVN
jgi:hypothetical protein